MRVSPIPQGPTPGPAAASTSSPATRPAAQPSAAAPSASTSGAPADPERLSEAVAQVNRTAHIFDRALEFEITAEHEIIIRVIDTTSGNVIRQIPPGELLAALRQGPRVDVRR